MDCSNVSEHMKFGLFQVPDWISTEAPTTSILKQLLQLVFHKYFYKTIVHFKLEINFLPK